VIPVDLAPEVAAAVRQMRGRGEQPPRSRAGVIRSAIAGVMRRLLENLESESRHGYQWTGAGGRMVLAEEIKKEIFDGATPYSTYVRGVVIDGDRGVLLTGRDHSAIVTEG
jgi:hypothetical protein